MGLLTALREKVSNPRASDGTKLNQEELRNLDALIEDLLRLDEQEKNENQKEKSE